MINIFFTIPRNKAEVNKKYHRKIQPGTTALFAQKINSHYSTIGIYYLCSAQSYPVDADT